MKAPSNNNNLELNLARIAMLGELIEDENIDFRIFLKGQDPDKVDRIVHRINKEVTAQIDCQQCGNCCKSLKPCVSESEINRLAQIKNMVVGEFMSQFVETDNFDGVKFLKDAPCIFLNDKSCSVYSDRPKDCRSYPHTHKPGFTSRTIRVIHNYGVCPIVYNVFER
ncbi:MAG: YkgJ family cysteine cluster protein [Bacteroidales bacterium]|nr:YkgJ family cysteine cluster protein [Bacteroidales bacterium]